MYPTDWQMSQAHLVHTQGRTGKKSEYPRGLFILLHSGEGSEQVKDSG